MRTLMQNIENQNENYLLPFLWVHGEEAEAIKNEIAKVYDSEIKALCVEARPHKDFNGKKWFEDLALILEECKHRGMKMWLLDDSHFPTGYANGEVCKNHPKLLKKFLYLKTYDFVGPMMGSGAILKYAIRDPEDEILGVYLQRRVGFEKIDVEETIDVTDTLHMVADYNFDRPNADFYGKQTPGTCGLTPVVNFDLPEGDWCLNVVAVSYHGGEKDTADYLNPIVAEATDILIDTVYEPVYERFKEEFGKTFMGFFSDEPRLGNIHGAEEASIGRNSEMDLPWRDGMLELLVERCHRVGGVLKETDEQSLPQLLPLLFIGEGKIAHALRYAYMDLMTELYSVNFDGRLTKWCHEHGCMHIGHCIEDNYAATRMGSGNGHLFRAMEYSDMAGIDVVLHQLVPGMNKGLFKGMHKPGWEGEFFTYLLGKLGGSLAHLDPKKKGRCMCELFGAYGWTEGNRLAKWMADYMLVRGVNYLVPHAFDCAPFPDSDCPPHFYAEGHNPQYPEFKILMDYCNRVCNLLSGGVAKPCVALYFNAEGEWCGDYMQTEKPAAVLTKGTIDFDLISADYLAGAVAENGLLCVNGMQIPALVLPWAESLPKSVLKDTLRLAEGGVRVWFVDELPNNVVQGDDENILDILKKNKNVSVVSLDNLAEVIRDEKIAELTCDKEEPYLRYYHYRQPDGDVYFFVNESHVNRVQTSVSGTKEGTFYVYDAFTNVATEDSQAFCLDLPPYGSKIVLVPDMPMEAQNKAEQFVVTESIPLEKHTLSLADMEELVAGRIENCSTKIEMDQVFYISSLPAYETFSGRLCYRFKIDLSEHQSIKKGRIVLKGVKEGAAVRVNGVDCGTKITPDYCFDITGLSSGENVIEVELNTTLGRHMNDYLSSFLPMEPVGMTGAVLELSE